MAPIFSRVTITDRECFFGIVRSSDTPSSYEDHHLVSFAIDVRQAALAAEIQAEANECRQIYVLTLSGTCSGLIMFAIET